MTIVVLPEYVARHWWDRMLYNQTAKRLKSALVGREHTVIADVPYRRATESLRPRPRLSLTARTGSGIGRAILDRSTRWYRDRACQNLRRRPSAAPSSRSTAAQATRGSSASWPSRPASPRRS